MSAPVKSRSEEFRELMKLAIPIAIAQGGQSLMGLVDTLVVGRAGTSALAAVGLANSLFYAVSSLGMGVMLGLDPLLSQAFGARNASRARALLWQGGWMALFTGLVLCFATLLVPEVLPFFGYAREQLVEARGYLYWRAPSLVTMLAFFMARSYLQSAGSTRPLVVATVTANIFNLGADILFVFGGGVLPEGFGPLRNIPAMGAAGAALATLLCTILQLVIVLAAVRSIRWEGPPPVRRPVLADLKQVARVGLPIGLHLAAEIGVFALAGVLAFKLGEASMGAHQIVLSFSSLTFTIAVGIGNAGGVRVGWAVGARNTPQARMSGFVALAGGSGFMALSAMVFAFFPQQLSRIAGASADVVPLVIPLMMVTAVFQVFDGLQGVGAGVLRGAGETRFTFVANMLGHYAIGLPLSLVLGFGLKLGIVGIWWGLCAGLISVALALLWRFHRLSSGTLRPLEA